MPNVYYLTSGPISSEAQETFTELGPGAGDIIAGQVLIDVVTIAVPEPSSMKLLGVDLAFAVFSIGSMHTFRARIRKNWIMRCVDVPAEIVQALGGGRGIPVLARYCGETAETTVVPGGGGKGRLILRMDILRPGGLEAGDTVEVSLEPDHASREPEVPPDFQRALRFRPEAAQAFQQAPVSGRRQIMLYIDAAKREETRASRIERIIERLSEDAKGA